MRSPAEVASRARLRYFSKTCRALPRTRPSGPLLSKVWVRGCPPPPPPPCCLRLVRPRGRRLLLEPYIIVHLIPHGCLATIAQHNRPFLLLRAMIHPQTYF